MKGKFQMIKQTAEGEQCSIETEFDTADKVKSAEELRNEFDPYFQLIDDRLREMNMRIIASNRLTKRMPAEAQMAIHQAIDYLYGRAPKQDVIKEYEAAVKEAEVNEEKAFDASKNGKKGGKGGPVGGPIGTA